MPFPRGEGRDAFIQRSLVGFSQMLEEIRGMNGEIKTVTAVVHGGTIMAILSKVCGGDYYDYQIPNGEGYCLQLELTEDDLRVLSLERI